MTTDNIRSKINPIIMTKLTRRILAAILVIIALVLAIYYFSKHKNLITQLKRTPVSLIFEILALNAVMFCVLVLIFSATLRVCQRQLTAKENAILNVNSLLINFFIPGQGGPAYRGIYLLKKHQVKLRNYIAATILYYLFFGVASLVILVAGSRPWWQTLPFAIVASSGIAVVFKWYEKRNKIDSKSLDLRFSPVMLLLAVTCLQVVVQMCIYGIELHSINRHIHLSQIVTYTGSANLALFVSLTPGAIGIRETFLIFTEKLHHISTANILLANTIDRGVYLIFLAILIIVVGIMHFSGSSYYKRLENSLKKS